MNLNQDQIIKDLELESMSKEDQETVIGSFSRGLQAKIQLNLIDRLDEKQKQEFAKMDDKAKDDFMEQAVGGDMDKFVDELYIESVAEFKEATDAIVKGISNPSSKTE